jgi:hypothetical protein
MSPEKDGRRISLSHDLVDRGAGGVAAYIRGTQHLFLLKLNYMLCPRIENSAGIAPEIEFLGTDLPRIETQERTDTGNPPILFKVERNFQII